MLQAGIYSFVTADVDVSALISTRFYPKHLPQSATYPAMVQQVITKSPVNTNGAASDLYEALVQFDCYTQEREGVDAYAEAHDVAKKLVTRIDSYSGLMGSVSVSAVIIIDAGTDFYEEEPGLNRVKVEARIFYQNS